MRRPRSRPAALSKGIILLAVFAATTACKKDASQPPGNLTYSQNPVVYTRGVSIEPNRPTSSGDKVDSYSVSPALPAGLSLHSATGMITGTPTAMAAVADYTVTATNSAGSATAIVSIAVNARLDVLFTTDEHSHLFGFSPELDDSVAPETSGSGLIKGGVLRRAALLEQERATAAAAGASSITVSAGDVSQGTLAAMSFLGTATDIVLMSLLGYDAVALGNHEFDTTPAGLAGAIHVAGLQSAVPPFVLTNAIFSSGSGDDDLEALYGPEELPTTRIAPHRIVTKDGIRTGVVAVMGALAARDAGPFAAPVTFSSADPADREAALAATFAAVQPVITALRPQVDVVVVLGHGGIRVPGSATPGDDERLAAALSGIDLVVSGHTHFEPGEPIYVQDPDGRQVPVLQVAPFGEGLGRAELVVQPGERPVFDAGRSAFVPVDDRIVALGTDFPVIQGAIDQVLGHLEDGQSGAPSPLEEALSEIEGTTVLHDPSHPGDLYFRALGHTSFDVPGLGIGETNVSNLDTDAMLDAARSLAGTTDVALQNRGSIRADLRKGTTGVLSFADVFATVALGLDPTDGRPGYPLVRVLLVTAELRAALEMTLQYAMAADPDYELLPSGLELEYDPTRTPFDSANPGGPGWITRIWLVDQAGIETPIFDASYAATGGWLVDPYAPLAVVTTYQVASFAEAFGVHLLDPATGTPTTPANAVLRRGDGSSVRDYQSLAAYVRSVCAANGGELPSRYDGSTAEGHVPRRVVCTGIACP